MGSSSGHHPWESQEAPVLSSGDLVSYLERDCFSPAHCQFPRSRGHVPGPEDTFKWMLMEEG